MGYWLRAHSDLRNNCFSGSFWKVRCGEQWVYSSLFIILGENIGRFSDNFAPVNTLKRITRPFLQSVSIIRLQITLGEFALFLTQLGRLAHCIPSAFTQFFVSETRKGRSARWPPSTFIQFSFFATTTGRLAHWPPSTFIQFSLFATTTGRLAHWPPSTFIQFICLQAHRVVWHIGHRAHSFSSVCLSSQIRENRLNSRFGPCRSLYVASFAWFAVNNNFKSKMLSKKNKPNNSLSNTVAKQYKLYSPNTEGFRHEVSIEVTIVGCQIRKRTLKRKHVPTLQWSAVLLIHTKTRQSAPLTNVQNQTGICVK